MVERRSTGKVYALKYISKAQVIRMDAVRNILRERQILETLDHAFVVNMRFAFQDDEYMYMCMDLMMGGDLRFHLNRKQFGEDVVRFWIAELCSALTHLHSQGIVHRDIKPDNVLLDEKGHAHLTDFNIGCKLTAEKPFLTSQSGTVAYMAPEVFGRHGYGTSVDWWAIGVLFYECIYNKRPFQTESISDLKKAIPTQTIEFPEKEGLSRECISAMRGFLTRDPKERLGIKGGMDGVRQHPFFQAGAYQTNPDNWWYMMETKQLTPKFQPSSENVNFDATYDLEELLLDDEPLTYRSTRKRAQRMQKEKDKAIKEENARIKAEQQQEAAAAAAAAELAMSSMALDDYYVVRNNTKESGMFPQKQDKHSSKTMAKKRSKLYLGGGASVGNKVDSESSGSGNNSSSQIHLSQSPAMPHANAYHSQSQYAPEPMNGAARGAPVPTNTPLQFPTLPLPSASAQSARHMHYPQHYQNGGYIRHQQGSSLPPPPSQGLPLNPTQLSQAANGNKHSLDSSNLKGGYSITTAGGGVQSGSTATGYSYSTSGTPGQGVTAIYLSKPAIPSSNGTYVSSLSYKGPSAGQMPVKGGARKAYCAEDDVFMGKSYPGSASQHIQQQYQQKQQQQQQFGSTSTSSSSSAGAPSSLPNPLPSRSQQQQQHKHIPPHHQHQHQQQHHAPMQRQASPLLVAATEVAAAKVAATTSSDPKNATASANMSRKEKFAYQMALIDREFLTFDYTVYEEYHGLVDPLTMSVGDPPEWVRSRDY
ncbi:hypothetical protein BGW39_005434 [Mortierella sp. 14UC]|nr:hypothetical protein BGW39_005434 [Mortierella sp. 14UC]